MFCSWTQSHTHLQPLRLGARPDCTEDVCVYIYLYLYIWIYFIILPLYILNVVPNKAALYSIKMCVEVCRICVLMSVVLSVFLTLMKRNQVNKPAAHLHTASVRA